MANKELARIFDAMADILEMLGVAWKPIAFRKAARNLDALADDVCDIYRQHGVEGLMEIPGVGEGIAKKIVAYLQTGKVKDYEQLKREIPRGVREMMAVPGLGPKKVWWLYTHRKIDSLKKLEDAARKGKIRVLTGFGKKSEEDLLRGLEVVKKGKERRLLGEMLPLALHLKEELERQPFVKKVDVAGSLRRMKETVRDIDLLVQSSQPENVMTFFTSLPQVETVLAKGGTKSSVVLREGISCDVRVVRRHYGAALQYFSGSKEHCVHVRNLAIKKGYKLNEYGLFRKGKKETFTCGNTEEEIYSALGMQYVPPELREDGGEVDAALQKALPRLIGYDEVKGDLHMHTTWSDGLASTQDMVKAAVKMGYQYIAITDHSKSTTIAHGLDEERLIKRIAELRKVQKGYPSLHLLAGSEVDILADGRLDYSDSVLKHLDFVVGSVHSRFTMSEKEMTKRLLTALDNRYLHVLGHPSGRLINQRSPYAFDVQKVIEKAGERGVALEINSFPSRLDLRDAHVRIVVEQKGRLCITTDSHAPDHLRFIPYGIGQARRGWAEKKHVINARPWKQFERFLAR